MSHGAPLRPQPPPAFRAPDLQRSGSPAGREAGPGHPPSQKGAGAKGKGKRRRGGRKWKKDWQGDQPDSEEPLAFRAARGQSPLPRGRHLEAAPGEDSRESVCSSASEARGEGPPRPQRRVQWQSPLASPARSPERFSRSPSRQEDAGRRQYSSQRPKGKGRGRRGRG